MTVLSFEGAYELFVFFSIHIVIAQDEIAEMELEKLKLIEELRKSMVHALNEASLEVMGLNNELAELEVKYYNLYCLVCDSV